MQRKPFSFFLAALFVLPALVVGPGAQATEAETENPYTVSTTTTYAKGYGVKFSGGGAEGRPFGSRTINYGHGRDQDWANPSSDSVPTWHTYNKPGTYTPVVHEYVNGEWLHWTLETVTVLQDTTAPVITFAIPEGSTVKAWSRVRFTAIDRETGMNRVGVRIYQKRGNMWYGNQGLGDWVKKSTKAKARKVAHALSPNRNNAATKWWLGVKGLKKGRTFIEITARNRAGIPATPIHHRVRIR